MIPHPIPSGALGSYEGQVFVAEKIGLDSMELVDIPARANDEEFDDEDDNIYM